MSHLKGFFGICKFKYFNGSIVYFLPSTSDDSIGFEVYSSIRCEGWVYNPDDFCFIVPSSTWLEEYMSMVHFKENPAATSTTSE